MKDLGERLATAFRANRRLLPAAVIIAVLVVALVAKYVGNYHEKAQKSIALNAEMYSVVKSGLKREKGLVASIGSAKKRIEELETGLLKAKKPAIAVAEIQEAIKKIASHRGLAIISQKALKTADRGPYIAIPVELQVKTSMPQLRKVLYDMMTADTIMKVGYLRARALDEKGSGQINVTLVVEGLMARVSGDGAGEPRS